MSHNVETMAYVGQLPWHGLGVNLGDKNVRGSEMLEAAGLNWRVSLEPVTATVNDITVTTDSFAVVRSDTSKSLGVVGSRYQEIQNEDLFGIPDVLVDEGRVGYNTAGSLRDGRIVWALAELSEYSIQRKGEAFDDTVKRYLLWTTRHDGLAPVIGGFTDVRVVCNNTLDAAMRGGLSNRFTIKHTRSATSKMAEAHRIFEKIITNGENQTVEFQVMADTAMTVDGMAKFSDSFLDAIQQENEIKNVELRAKRRKEQVDELVNLFTDGTGNTGESLWDGYNAVTEFLDHHKRRYHGATETIKQEKHLDSLLNGAKFKAKGKARKLLA